jgi:N-acetylglutamate synthase-like GNAT family acetyltransferase
MIDPGHQRRGIGKQLLEAMMSKIEQDSLPAFIVSSRESHRLYLQLGFVDVAHRSIDNEAWAKELCRVEQQAGIAQHANLPAQYQGITEDEHLMVRWPKGENTCK